MSEKGPQEEEILREGVLKQGWSRGGGDNRNYGEQCASVYEHFCVHTNTKSMQQSLVSLIMYLFSNGRNLDPCASWSTRPNHIKRTGFLEMDWKLIISTPRDHLRRLLRLNRRIMNHLIVGNICIHNIQ